MRKWCAVRGYPLLTTVRRCERRAACGSASAVVLLGFTLAGPQIRNGVEAEPRAWRLEACRMAPAASRLFRV